MPVLAAPDLLSLKLRLSNRIAQLRAAPGEAVFHTLAVLAVLAVVLWALQPSLLRIARWEPQALQVGLGTALAFVVLQLAARKDAQAYAGFLSEGWLAASAWSVQGRRQALRRRVVHAVVLRLLLLSGLLLAWQMARPAALPQAVWLGLAALWCSVPPLAVLCWTRRIRQPAVSRSQTTLAAAAVPAGLSGQALLQHGWRAPPLRSQRRQALLAMLVLPGGMSGLLGLAVLALILLLLWGGRCFAHYRDTVFASSRWLRATVASPGWLATALLPSLSYRLLLVLGIAAVALRAAGAPWWWLGLGGLAMLAVISLCCLQVLVHREQPQGYRRATRLQALLLLMLLQSLPPVALLGWFWMMVRARRALLKPAMGHHE